VTERDASAMAFDGGLVMRIWKKLLLAAWFVSLPASVYAQASIAGVVKDISGAVLPGVTVEASSPALIEKTRAVVTDGTGQFRIVDLRPGTYAVTFTLTGFSTVKRDEIELTGSFTATVNADLRVGSVSETITVRGETPIVDVQNIRRQTSISNATLNEIPTTRSYGSILLLMPAVASSGNAPSDTSVTPTMVVFGAPGGRGGEGRVQVDGLGIGAAIGGSGSSSYVADTANAQEVTFTNQGGLGESETGGGVINVVGRTGGNQVRGSFFGARVNSNMVSDNLTARLKEQFQGQTFSSNSMDSVWDVNLGIGGPIKKDRVWFFSNVRTVGVYYVVPGMVPNLNAFDPTKWTYVPDLTPGRRVLIQPVNGNYKNASVRLTFQASRRHRFNAFWDEQRPCNGASYDQSVSACKHQPTSGLDIIGGTATTAPETSGIWDQPTRTQQITWSSPVTNKLLVEAGFGNWLGRFGAPNGNTGQKGSPNTKDLIRVTELCIGGCPANGNIQGLTYRSASWANSWSANNSWRASVSRVTGAHTMKFGYQGTLLVWDTGTFTNSTNLAYSINNGSANNAFSSLTMTLNPLYGANRVAGAAFYAQEQWTLGRATLQGAIRYDRAWSYFPAQQVGFTTFQPTSSFAYPETQGVSWNDITPRGGIAYDLFGNGKTAIKINAGKYLEPLTTGGTFSAPNPTNRLTTTTSRTWNDLNRNFVPDCNLTNPLAQNLSASGGDTCGPFGTSTFLQNVFTSGVDPSLLTGWGKRGADYAFSASIQREIVARTSVEVGYNWRRLVNFTTSDNTLVTAADFDRFSITAPLDARLPGGGGYVVNDLFNVSNTKFGQTNNVLSFGNDFGSWTQSYNGMLLQVNARPRNGLTMQGGFNVGKTSTDNCTVRSVLPETNPNNPYCNSNTGFVTRVSGFASYLMPKIDVLVSTAFRSEQGAQLSANWAAPITAAPSLGRPFAGGLGTQTVNLITPGTLYGDRNNLVDFRIAKVIRFKRTRTNVGIDVYNLMNADTVLAYNNTFTPNTATTVGRWLVPTSIVTPRFFKFSAQIDF
jgi:Carboxypeptidase regulatory-like domain